MLNYGNYIAILPGLLQDINFGKHDVKGLVQNIFKAYKNELLKVVSISKTIQHYFFKENLSPCNQEFRFQFKWELTCGNGRYPPSFQLVSNGTRFFNI